MTARLLAAVLAAALLGGPARPAEAVRSDTAAMSPALQAMQADDGANPGMLAVAEGADLWDALPEGGGRSCAECHGAPERMRGVAARYPAWSPRAGAPIDLGRQVELCRTERQGAPAFGPESRERLALTALIGQSSRGVAIAPAPGPGMDAARARGRALWTRRMGQLNLACAHCHDDHPGGRLGGAPIPQAHPAGYPIYRLEWQAVGSLQRRFRNCMTGVRAEAFPYDARDYVDLEAFLNERAGGLPIETPAVRP